MQASEHLCDPSSFTAERSNLRIRSAVSETSSFRILETMYSKGCNSAIGASERKTHRSVHRSHPTSVVKDRNIFVEFSNRQPSKRMSQTGIFHHAACNHNLLRKMFVENRRPEQKQTPSYSSTGGAHSAISGAQKKKHSAKVTIPQTNRQATIPLLARLQQ